MLLPNLRPPKKRENNVSSTVSGTVDMVVLIHVLTKDCSGRKELRNLI
jgi:hypothetical protein